MLSMGNAVLSMKVTYSNTTSQTIGPLPTDYYGVEVNNDSGSSMTIQIGTVIVTILNGEYFANVFDPFNTIIITATGAWRLHLLA